jgi:uncharacterized protein
MLFRFILVCFAYISLCAYVYLRLKSFTYKHASYRWFILISHFLILVFFFGIFFFGGKPHLNYQIFTYYFHLNFFFLLTSLLIFFLFLNYVFGDILILLFLRKIRQGSKIALRNIFHKIAVSVYGILLIILGFGYLFGTSDFTVREYNLHFKTLPKNFDSLKIVHFSDTHLGSFINKKHVKKGIQLIQKQQADLILFTGDLVNISADEAKPYVDLFSELETKYGKFAVLGNHDMSDYRKMDIDRDSLNVNTLEIVQVFNSMGFMVLRDTVVQIISNGDTVQIAGTDNWGKPPFKAYGNPEKIFSQLQPDKFTILLSHDPSFWKTFIGDHTSVDLTLSGHTHGMQMGIRTKKFQWSPASLMYPHWSGLYQNGKQILHVNPGFGFIGMPVRVGIKPEITVLNLNN